MSTSKKNRRRERVAEALIAKYSGGLDYIMYREHGWVGLKSKRHPDLTSIRKRFLRMADVALEAADAEK